MSVHNWESDRKEHYTTHLRKSAGYTFLCPTTQTISIVHPSSHISFGVESWKSVYLKSEPRRLREKALAGALEMKL